MFLLRTTLLILCLFDAASSLTDLSISSAFRAAGPELAAAMPYDVRPGNPWPTPDDELLSIEDAEASTVWGERIPPVRQQQPVNQQHTTAWDVHVPTSDLSAFEHVTGISGQPDDRKQGLASRIPPRSNLAVSTDGLDEVGLDIPLPLEPSLSGLDRRQDTALLLARVSEAAATLEQDAATLSRQLQILGDTSQQNPPVAAGTLQFQFPSAAYVTDAASNSRTPQKKDRPQQVLQQPAVAALLGVSTASEKSDCLFGMEKCDLFKKYVKQGFSHNLAMGGVIALWSFVILGICYLCWRCGKSVGGRH